MAPGLLQRIKSKINLWRLEQRYTRHRDKRTTFVSNATYVDGEYVYQTPNTTGSSKNSSNLPFVFDGESPSASRLASRQSRTPSEVLELSPATTQPSMRTHETMSGSEAKKLNRFSSIGAFGSSRRKEGLSRVWSPRRASFDGSRY